MSIPKNKILIFIMIMMIIVLLYSVPFVTSTNITFRLASVFVMALFAMSFNVLLGYTGLVSFGQAAYFAIGAYSYALFIEVFPNFFIGIFFSILCSALSSLILGYLSFRASGIYFAILTLALGQLVYLFFYQSTWSGGQNGLAGIKAPPINIGGWELKLSGMPHYYFVVVTVVVLSIFILWMIVHSRFGQKLIAIREDATRALFLGVNIKRIQLFAFVISSTFTGLAGALYAPLNSVITADIASWTHSATPIIISLLGGFHYFLGPAIGALIFEVFHYFTSSLADSADLFVGILLLLVILVMPKGVLGINETIREKMSRNKRMLQDKQGWKKGKSA